VEDKKELLEAYDEELLKEKNLSFKTLIIVYLSVFLALAIFLPNIYIKNEIYYISRDIGELYDQHELLNEENKNLKLQIELIRFKNQVLDTLAID
jgi:cell division protein FtsL